MRKVYFFGQRHKWLGRKNSITPIGSPNTPIRNTRNFLPSRLSHLFTTQAKNASLHLYLAHKLYLVVKIDEYMVLKLWSGTSEVSSLVLGSPEKGYRNCVKRRPRCIFRGFFFS